MKTHALRLTCGLDLKRELDVLTKQQEWRAACVVAAVGSLSVATIRYAGQEAVTALDGPLEIVSLSGTLSRDGSHLHLAVGDGQGRMRGGHLKEGSRVATTAEIVIGILDGWQFSRAIDLKTGCAELTIEYDELSRQK